MLIISLQLSDLILKVKPAAAGAINPTVEPHIQWTRLFTWIKYEVGLVIPQETNAVIYEAEGRPNAQL